MKPSLAAVALVTAGLLSLVPGTAAAADEIRRVTPTTFQLSFASGEVIAPSSARFVTGPAPAPLGSGSLELRTDADGARQQRLGDVAPFKYGPLRGLDAIGYTARHSGTSTAAWPPRVASLSMEIDFNGSGQGGGFTTLSYDPADNPAQGAVAVDTWQRWDAYAGGAARWRSSLPMPGVCDSCTASWSEILAANPDATLTTFGFDQGTGNAGLVSFLDAVRLGGGGTTVTFDFEPPAQPTSADQCKNGGWHDVAYGTTFTNQGDCVSFVATGGQNAPRG